MRRYDLCYIYDKMIYIKVLFSIKILSKLFDVNIYKLNEKIQNCSLIFIFKLFFYFRTDCKVK